MAKFTAIDMGGAYSAEYTKGFISGSNLFTPNYSSKNQILEMNRYNFTHIVDKIISNVKAGMIWNIDFDEIMYDVTQMARRLCPFEPIILHERRHPDQPSHLYEFIKYYKTFKSHELHGLIGFDKEVAEYGAMQHEDVTLHHPPKKYVNYDPNKKYAKMKYDTINLKDFYNPLAGRLGLIVLPSSSISAELDGVNGQYGSAKFIERAMLIAAPYVYDKIKDGPMLSLNALRERGIIPEAYSPAKARVWGK